MTEILHWDKKHNIDVSCSSPLVISRPKFWLFNLSLFHPSRHKREWARLATKCSAFPSNFGILPLANSIRTSIITISKQSYLINFSVPGPRFAMLRKLMWQIWFYVTWRNDFCNCMSKMWKWLRMHILQNKNYLQTLLAMMEPKMSSGTQNMVNLSWSVEQDIDCAALNASLHIIIFVSLYVISLLHSLHLSTKKKMEILKWTPAQI